MEYAIQLDLFDKDEIAMLRREVCELRKRLGNVQRGTFREIGILKKDNLFLQEQIDEIRFILAGTKASLFDVKPDAKVYDANDLFLRAI